MVILERQTCLNFGAPSTFSGSGSTGSANSTQSTTSGSSPFSFNTGATTTVSPPSFGGTTTTTPVSSTLTASSDGGSFSFGGVANNTTTTCFGSSNTTQNNSTSGATFGALQTNASSTSPATTTGTGGFGFGSSGFGTQSQNTSTFLPVPQTQNNAQFNFGCSNVFQSSTINSGEYIHLVGPNGGDLIKKCTDLCDLEIKILSNDIIHTTMNCNRLLLTNLSDKFDQLIKSKIVKHSDKYILTISTEEFESSIGKFDVQILKHLFECLIKGPTELHVDHSFHLLILLNHLDLIPTMRVLRNLICNSFTQQHALLFTTKFNSYYSEGRFVNVEMMSLFLTSLNNVVAGIDRIANQYAFGKINQHLFEYFLSSKSKTSPLSSIFHSIDIWLESNKTVANDPIQVATLLDSIHLESPKDHSQIISTLSCCPSRFQFLNTLDPQMRLKLVHRHALLIK